MESPCGKANEKQPPAFGAGAEGKGTEMIHGCFSKGRLKQVLSGGVERSSWLGQRPRVALKTVRTLLEYTANEDLGLDDVKVGSYLGQGGAETLVGDRPVRVPDNDQGKRVIMVKEAGIRSGEGRT